MLNIFPKKYIYTKEEENFHKHILTWLGLVKTNASYLFIANFQGPTVTNQANLSSNI